MQRFAAMAGLATLALSLLVCVRLILVALRTRGAPEIAMGTYQALVASVCLWLGFFPPAARRGLVARSAAPA